MIQQIIYLLHLTNVIILFGGSLYDDRILTLFVPC